MSREEKEVLKVCKMSALDVPPTDSAIVLGSTTTTANKEETEDALALVPHQGQKARWLELFHRLPTELHVHIMEAMDRDPVAQICFGLTNKFFYGVYHMAKDYFQHGKRVYPIKSRPLDLRMQISTDGQYMYHGWVEPWGYLDYVDDIQWHPPLGLLLQHEKIWGDLVYCEECARYKPNEAFERSSYEKVVEAKGLDWKTTVDEIFSGDADWYCARCRAKAILVHVEKRHEWREDQVLEEERTSLGLRKLDWEEYLVEDDSYRRNRMTLQNYLELVGGYESWEEVFAKLSI